MIQKQINKEACWVISNIAAGTVDQIMELFNIRGLIQTICKLATKAPWDLKKEAIWTLVNIMISGSDDQVKHLVQREGLGPIAKILSVENADVSVLCAALDALEQVFNVGARQGARFEHIFAEHGGVSYLEDLQRHESDEVYNKAFRIIDNFFVAEEAEDQDQESENQIPETTEQGTFRFGVTTPKQLSFGESTYFHGTTQPPLQFGQVSNRR